MPELPEVETIRRALEPRLIGRVVERAVLHRRDVLVMPGKRSPTPTSPRDLLEGARVTRLCRRGKQMAIIAAADDVERVLIVQLGMSGQLLWADDAGAPVDHVHAEWAIAGERRLFFRDPRRFGGLRALSTAAALEDEWRSLGPDALDVTARHLHEALNATDRSLKATLLDQSVLAGLGNIYVDEALFLAGLHPARRASSLKRRPEASERLAAAIVRVLTEALSHGGSTLRDYYGPDGSPGGFQHRHRVYGRSGQPCAVCGDPIQSQTLAGRTTCWCPGCQPRR
jgi:formamidopyrimidine-DNA glycosylase